MGWCLWLQGKIPESQKAFQTAVERLPLSADQATAYFKLADAEFLQQDFAGAITNYDAIIEKFEALPEVKTNLFEPALYQTVRAAAAARNLAAATNAVQKILAWYPHGFHAVRALLITGQEISREGNPAEARQLFLSTIDLVKSAPNPDLLPEMQLAVARTYEQENKWAEAIEQYNGWLAAFTNHPARPRALYYSGWANSRAGRDTNALMQFTNLVAQFPTNEFWPRAQWWVADYYFQNGNSEDAELSYQLLFKNTNFPPSELTYQAQMMAGRVAFKRQGWKDAIGYFTNLTSNPKCPEDLRVQAQIAYGDTLMKLPDPAQTNSLSNYEEAIRVFRNICENYPSNKNTVLAWGEMADCYLQRLSRQAEADTNALDGFQRVIASPFADATARSIAKVGIATFLKKQAEHKTGPEQAALLRLAYNHLLDVFYRKIFRDDEKPDLFWLKEAGLEAGRLAETLQEWKQAKRIYEQLRELLPPLRARFEKNLARIQEHIPGE